MAVVVQSAAVSAKDSLPVYLRPCLTRLFSHLVRPLDLKLPTTLPSDAFAKRFSRALALKNYFIVEAKTSILAAKRMLLSLISSLT
jgi:hypothetical protein